MTTLASTPIVSHGLSTEKSYPSLTVEQAHGFSWGDYTASQGVDSMLETISQDMTIPSTMPTQSTVITNSHVIDRGDNIIESPTRTSPTVTSDTDAARPAIAPFLLKMLEMVNSSENNAIISWSDDGKTLVVKDVEALASRVLPKYFNHSKWASFLRQLHMYGFRKTKSLSETTPGALCFGHPVICQNISFEALSSIKRRCNAYITPARPPSTRAGASGIQYNAFGTRPKRSHEQSNELKSQTSKYVDSYKKTNKPSRSSRLSSKHSDNSNSSDNYYADDKTDSHVRSHHSQFVMPFNSYQDVSARPITTSSQALYDAKSSDIHGGQRSIFVHQNAPLSDNHHYMSHIPNIVDFRSVTHPPLSSFSGPFSDNIPYQSSAVRDASPHVLDGRMAHHNHSRTNAVTETTQMRAWNSTWHAFPPTASTYNPLPQNHHDTFHEQGSHTVRPNQDTFTSVKYAYGSSLHQSQRTAPVSMPQPTESVLNGDYAHQNPTHNFSAFYTDNAHGSGTGRITIGNHSTTHADVVTIPTALALDGTDEFTASFDDFSPFASMPENTQTNTVPSLSADEQEDSMFAIDLGYRAGSSSQRRASTATAPTQMYQYNSPNTDSFLGSVSRSYGQIAASSHSYTQTQPVEATQQDDENSFLSSFQDEIGYDFGHATHHSTLSFDDTC